MNGNPSSPLPASSADFRDRTTGLVVFGILQVVFGCCAVMMIPFMLLGQAMASRVNQEAAPLRQMIPGALFYAIIAAVLIALGIGSCKTRRWARGLSLVVGWSWLFLGLVSTVTTSLLLPSLFKAAQPASGQQLPEAARIIGMVFALAFMAVVFVVIPAILVFFYSSRHVRATCEARDPVPGWTDACPLPVLALSLWLGTAAFGALVMPWSTNGVLPFFGTVVSGVLGVLACILLAGLWSYCAWAVYRCSATGWWVVLVSLCIMAASAGITFSRMEPAALYQAMGYTERQLEMMKQYGFVRTQVMAALSVAGLVPMLGYMFFVKRYFR